jgi:hypothetical protein
VAGGFGMLLADAVHDAGNIGLCLGERNSRLETANDVEVMVFAISAEFAFPIGGGAEDFGNDIDGVDPELDVAAIAETRREGLRRSARIDCRGRWFCR